MTPDYVWYKVISVWHLTVFGTGWLVCWVVYQDVLGTGCSVFLPHALLLRGTFYSLWRDNAKAQKDLDAVIETEGVEKEVGLDLV